MKVATKVLLIIGLCTGFGFCKSTETITLLRIPPAQAPVVKRNIAHYTFVFEFDRVPNEHWIYYDKNNKMLVLEFFGVSFADSLPTLMDTTVVKKIMVENGKTELALNNKMARLLLSLNPGWHYASKVKEEKVVRLSLWKEIDLRKGYKKKRNVFAFILAGIVLSLLTTAVAFTVSR